MQTSSVRPVWKVILARGISIVVMGLLVFGVWTGESNQRQKFELTETDVTAIKNFRADQITVYGVSLGMTRNEAEALLRANEGIIVEQDRLNPTRLHVYDKGPDGFKNRCILYYIWRPNDPGLAYITVFEDCAKHLKGNTRFLLTLAALDPRSGISKSFLRYPNRSKVTLDIPMIEVKHTTYYYDDKWLEITHKNHMGENTVVFALVRQPRRVIKAGEELGEKQDISDFSKRAKRTYSGLGGGHWIAEKIERGRQIKLEDGSLWKISVRHRLRTMLWEVSQKVTVAENDDLLYPYRLTNQNTGDTVEVELVSE